MNAPDDLLLEACWEDRRVQVSQDRDRIRDGAGAKHAGVCAVDVPPIR